MRAVSNPLQEQGVTVIKALASRPETQQMTAVLHLYLQQYAHELGCSLPDYLTNVSRWVYPAALVGHFLPWIDAHLKKSIGDFIGEPVQLAKVNIISKSQYARQPVPCHQDIAYSPDNPYEFSVWLALQPVGLTDGVLEFLPGSHHEKIASAVDFWQPHFVDQMALSARWRQQAIAFPVSAGDAIVFDSRTWHRSVGNQSGQDRFALVTRWSRLSYQPPVEVPPKIKAHFGMWQCGKTTATLLQQGIQRCCQHTIAPDLTTCITAWQTRLLQSQTLPFAVDTAKAQQALQGVLILNRAAELQHGGDAQGTIYANLWHHLLQPLSQWLQQTSTDSG